MNVNVPVAEPTAVGEKVTPTVQLFPASTLVPQVLLATANGPLATMLVMLSGLPVYWSMSPFWQRWSLPATVVLKLRLVTERVTGALPVPDRLTV